MNGAVDFPQAAAEAARGINAAYELMEPRQQVGHS